MWTLKALLPSYVKSQKNDAADAEAICEAVMRPSMRFVETKTPEQQSCLMLHPARTVAQEETQVDTSGLFFPCAGSVFADREAKIL